MVTKVYPRVCGGTTSATLSRNNDVGLSPRVRGNHSPIDMSGRPLRSIPACAGEPSYQAPRYEQGPVYPRVCGGTGTCHRRPSYLGGLSPRVRGNPHSPRPGV